MQFLEECCSLCGTSFDGGPIPENIREHYSPPYRWGRKIGLSDGDSVYAWKCPDCGYSWLRAEMYRFRAQRAGFFDVDGTCEEIPDKENQMLQIETAPKPFHLYGPGDEDDWDLDEIEEERRQRHEEARLERERLKMEKIEREKKEAEKKK